MIRVVVAYIVKRFDNWSDITMVILISGVSCTGKTVMAQKLLIK
ncbi:hypothetical protein [Clostridium sp. YIM B02506]|nr:hypothetical protein [Clostridium sp. YIM B02506]